MYCSSCGAPNPDNASWCAQCGAPLQAPAPAAPAASYVPAAPHMPVPQPAPVHVSRHLGLAVFSLLSGFCCCFPIGFIAAIISFVSALSVNGRLAVNDVQGARRASSRAAFWGWLAILSGIIGLGISIAYVVINQKEILDALQRVK
jgi:hypothetical protein